MSVDGFEDVGKDGEKNVYDDGAFENYEIKSLEGKITIKIPKEFFRQLVMKEVFKINKEYENLLYRVRILEREAVRKK